MLFNHLINKKQTQPNEQTQTQTNKQTNIPARENILLSWSLKLISSLCCLQSFKQQIKQTQTQQINKQQTSKRKYPSFVVCLLKLVILLMLFIII
jgi:hypothetical protein